MMEFTAGKIVHKDELNNMARQQKFGVISGCETTADSPASLNVIVSAGTYLIDGVKYTTLGDTITITPDATYNSSATILLDTSGVVSVEYGALSLNDDTTGKPLPTYDYDPDTHLPIARIFVGGGVSAISQSNIKSLRIESYKIEELIQKNVILENKADYSLIKNLLYQDKQGEIINEEGIYVDGMKNNRLYDNTNFTYDSTNDFWYCSSASGQLISDQIPNASSGDELFSYFDFEIESLYDEFIGTSGTPLSTDNWTSYNSYVGGKIVYSNNTVWINPQPNRVNNSHITSNGITNQINFYTIPGVIFCKIQMSMSQSNSGYGNIMLTNLTTTITIKTFNSEISTTDFILEVDNINKKARIINYISGVIEDWIDISTITTNCYLRICAGLSTTNGGAALTVYNVKLLSKDNYSSIITLEGTCDGTNWETINNKERATLSNSGTIKQARINFTQSGDEIIRIKGIGLIE